MSINHINYKLCSTFHEVNSSGDENLADKNKLLRSHCFNQSFNYIDLKINNQSICKNKKIKKIVEHKQSNDFKNMTKFEINKIISLLRSHNGDSTKVSLLYPSKSIEQIEYIKKIKSFRINFISKEFTKEDDELLLKCISVYGEKYMKLVKIFKGTKSITELKGRYKKIKMMRIFLNSDEENTSKNSKKTDNSSIILLNRKRRIKENIKLKENNNNGHYDYKNIYKNNEKCDYYQVLCKKLDIVYKTYLFINQYFSCKFFLSSKKNIYEKSSLSYLIIKKRGKFIHEINLIINNLIKTYKERYIFNEKRQYDKESILIKIENLLELGKIIKLKEKLILC